MYSLTMEYCSKISQRSFLSCPVYWLLGQNVGGVLVGGIISRLAERLKSCFGAYYLAERVVGCLLLMSPKYLSTWLEI